MKQVGTTLKAKAHVQANKALRTSLVSQLDSAASSFGERVAPPQAMAVVKKEKKLKAWDLIRFRQHDNFLV